VFAELKAVFFLNPLDSTKGRPRRAAPTVRSEASKW
jgi:hypothetical protein